MENNYEQRTILNNFTIEDTKENLMRKNDNLPLNLKERTNSKISLLTSIAVLAVLCLIFNQMDYNMIRKPAAQAQKAAEAEKRKEEEAAAAAPEVTTATVMAVGDNLVQPSLLQSGQYESGTWNYDHVFANFLSEIQAADIAMINQETPFTSSHDAVSGRAPYATPTEMGDALVTAGFNVVTSATAFMDDNGYGFLSQTFDFWSSSHPDVTLLGIHSTQEDADTVKTLEVNGIKIAFLNYTFPSSGTESAGKEYMIDTFDTQTVATAIQNAKAAADCVIFAANWGKTEEPMPTEYEKQWANFLMQQGVDVVIGTNPNVLQPYGYLTDDEGHNMLIYYSLGNFVSGQETLKQLLGGMANFTIQKTVNGDDTSIKITDAAITPLVMHYSYDSGDYTPYLLSDYTEDLASQHSVREIIGDEFSLENLQTKYDEIMSMNVTPSTKSNLLDVRFDADGNMVDASGNYVEDTDSITSGQYYTNLANAQSSNNTGNDSDSEE